ncbi:MAG: hypothetical protein N4A41_00450 [Crocinitomicaceae bacterium]|jgi:outer membrane murein-binding lipoprotein Lpp|nr:hypothetical protein [Crocinitomicaceae bacterium]
MLKEFENASDSLVKLGDYIDRISNDKRPLSEIRGWNCPPVTFEDFSVMLFGLAEKIGNYEDGNVESHIIEDISQIPDRIAGFMKLSGPQMANANTSGTIAPLLSLIVWIQSLVNSLYSWENVQDGKHLPRQLNRKLRSIENDLNSLIPKKDELKDQIELIKSATETAENLPTDLQLLNESRKKIDKISTDCAEIFGKIDKYYNEIQAYNDSIKNRKTEADSLVVQCEEAYKITTSRGLAGAFDLRAKSLNNSMWIWALVLAATLLAGVFIGANRFESIKDAINAGKEVKYIWVQIFLSIISFGAPIWLAWISTKQIGQRFKLSEDYAYKASVAKAYEGYRREAAKIDPKLESRLFNSALNRLDEAPIRFVENEHHGSPWHELINSPSFKDAIEKSPSLKQRISKIVGNKTEVVKGENNDVLTQGEV